MSGQPEIIIDCAACHKEFGRYASVKDVPKSFTCEHCNTGQTVPKKQTIGYSHKRNYPQGFWENQ